MIYFGIVLGIGIMAGMIYVAFDKKSSSITRLASLIALGVMVLTVIICLFVVFTNKTVPFDESVLIVGAPVETKKDSGNAIPLLFSVVLLLALYGILAYFALKEQKKNIPKKKTKKEAEDNFEY